ncbi:MAG: L,D-transpeptidase [Candidatus Gracilibacteria bacterium]|nr:L,D-transpeptidase [Candidatus Gracilibacteria bacterium]
MKNTVIFLNEEIYKIEKNKTIEELINNTVVGLEKERNTPRMLNIDKYINQIENYLKIETHNNGDLKKVLNKLREYKDKGKKMFPLYGKKVYSPNVDRNTFVENTSIALKNTIDDGYNIISEEKLKVDASSCERLNGKSKNNDAYIIEKDGLFRMYYFRNGNLKLAFLVSPGKKDGKGGGYSKTKEGNFKLGKVDINHISSAFRGFKIDDRTGIITGWAMLVSRNFNSEGQAVHIGNKITGKRESHGCIRMFPKDAILLSQYDNIQLHVLDA